MGREARAYLIRSVNFSQSSQSFFSFPELMISPLRVIRLYFKCLRLWIHCPHTDVVFLHLSTSSPSSSSPKVCHGLMLCCETTTKQEAAPCVPESSSNTNRSFITAVVNAQHSTIYLIYLSFVELQKIFIITLKRSPVLQYSTVVISMQEEKRQIRTQAKMVISWINHDPFIR